MNTLQAQNQDLQRRLNECMQHRALCEGKMEHLKAEKEYFEAIYLKILKQKEPPPDEVPRFGTAQLGPENLREEASSVYASRLENENQALKRIKLQLEGEIRQLANQRPGKNEGNYNMQTKETENENSRLRNHIFGLKTLLDEKNKEIDDLNRRLAGPAQGNEEKMQLFVGIVLLAAEVERLHFILQEIKDGMRLPDESQEHEKEMSFVLMSSEIESLKQQLNLVLLKSNQEESLSKDVRIVLMATEIDRLREELIKANTHKSMPRETKSDWSHQEYIDTKMQLLKEKLLAAEKETVRVNFENTKYQNDYYDLELKYQDLEARYKTVIASLKAAKQSNSQEFPEKQPSLGSRNEEKINDLRQKNMKHEEMTILYMIEIERLHNTIESLTKIIRDSGL